MQFATAMTGARRARSSTSRACRLAWLAAVPLKVHAADALARTADLADLSLEQLGNIVVTSVARRAESLASAAASVYVISAEDIRRSGGTTLPEVLRLAPNLDVARADANQYAISARGFNNVLANKLLVLIDGRTVYSPLFSGVFWESQDVLLADVERIEVISGPGSTLWGANAFSGVINVITRPASETQGVLAYAGGGNLENGGAARYGGALPNGGAYRLYAKYFHRDHTSLADGSAIRDSSDRTQAGFRSDWSAAQATWTLQGDACTGDIDQAPAGRTIGGANLLARYTRTFDDGGSIRLQAYYDHTERDHRQQFTERLDTLDVDAQYGRTMLERHQLLLGAGYRASRDRVGNSASQAFVPAERTLQWSNVFVQDEIALTSALAATLGAKVEHNIYTGSEFLPTVRIGWRATPEFFAWGAASRTVRAPSRIDRDLFFPGQPPFVLVANETFRSEVADVYELGVRGQPLSALSCSVTVFRERYDRLRDIEIGPSGLVFGNGIEGRSLGVEAWAAWRITPIWRLTGGITALHQHLQVKPGHRDFGGLPALGNDPSAWWSLRSSFDLSPQHEFDVAVRHTGARDNPAVPAYTAVDARAGWHPSRAVELSLSATNVFAHRQIEWGNRAELDRGVFLKVIWTP
jgi:iron complex outermembrane receptor protein